MEIIDKLFNRIIKGKLKSLSKEDVELLQKETLKETPKRWDISTEELLGIALENCKVGDIFVSYEESAHIVFYRDSTYVAVGQINGEEISVVFYVKE